MFLFFFRHKCHSALRAIAGMIRNHFRMHRTGVFLFLLVLLLVIVLAAWAMGAALSDEPNGSVAPTCAAAVIVSVVALIRIKICFRILRSVVGQARRLRRSVRMQNGTVALQRKIRDPEIGTAYARKGGA